MGESKVLAVVFCCFALKMVVVFFSVYLKWLLSIDSYVLKRGHAAS